MRNIKHREVIRAKSISNKMTIEKEKPLWILGYGSLIFKPPPFASTPIPGYIKGYVRRFWQSSSDHRGTPERKGRVATLVSYADVLKDKEMLKDVVHYEGDRVDKAEGQEDINVKEEDLSVQCCVYYIAPEHAPEVKEYLDIREQDGYTLHTVSFLIEPDTTSISANVKHHQHLRAGTVLDPEAQKQLDALPTNEAGQKILECQVYIGTTSNESFVGPESTSDTAQVIAFSRGPSGENKVYLEELVSALKTLGEEDLYLEELLQKVEDLACNS